MEVAGRATTAVTRMLGYTEQEVLGQNPRIFQSGRHDKGFYQAMYSFAMTKASF